MQHRGDADLRAEMFGVASNGDHRLGGRFEQQVVDNALIVVGDVGNRRRQREHDMKISDVDGEAGRHSLNALLADLGIGNVADLTGVVSRTPSGGLHLIFKLQPRERPRTRASDIAPGLDTRGVKADGSSGGYFIAPGSVLPDGRRYELIDPACLADAEDMA